MVMLAGIAGGFGQALADDQKEKKAWLRDQKMMNRKYAMTTGTAAIGAANDKRDAVLRKSAYLTDRGIDNNTLMYIFDEGGVAGIDSVYDVLQNTDAKASKEQINALVTGAKDYAAADGENFNSVLNRAFGLYKEDPAPEKVEEKGFWQRMFDDPVDQAFKDDGTVYTGGYTLADIYRIQGTSTPMGSGSVSIDRSAAPISRNPTDEIRISNNLLTRNEGKLQELNSKVISSDLSNEDKSRLQTAISNAVIDGDFSALPEEYKKDLLKVYIEREQSDLGSVIYNENIDAGTIAAVKAIVYPPDPVEVKPIVLSEEDITTQKTTEIATAIESQLTKLSTEELDNLPTYTQIDLDNFKTNKETPKNTYFFDDQKGNITLMLPPPVKETRVTKEETVDKLITGQDSSDDILPYTITKEQWNKLPRYARRNYAEATGGNYTPLARLVGFFTGSNTLTTDEAINSVNKRLQLDPNKSYYVKSSMNPERIMKGSLIQRIDVEHFANPRDGIIIKRQATNEEIKEANGFKLKQNRPWDERDFLNAFSSLLKK